MIHRQSQQDIRDAGYRTACYDGPDTSDRLAVLLRPSQSAWLSLNFYRPRTYGCAGPAEIQTLENYAPMFAQAAKAHYRLTMASGGTLEPMLAKLTVASPTLTKRELDVLRGILEGLSREEISLRMGVKVSSVETYQKRAYARLGISRQRQLFALCMLDSSVI
jgi:DNA-binding CsgD family transcriptional regulator